MVDRGAIGRGLIVTGGDLRLACDRGLVSEPAGRGVKPRKRSPMGMLVPLWIMARCLSSYFGFDTDITTRARHDLRPQGLLSGSAGSALGAIMIMETSHRHLC